MAKLNHAKIIKGFEALRQTTNGKDFFVGFLKTFGFPAATIRNVQDPRERQKFCVHGIIGARQTGASNEHEHQTQFS